MKERTLVIFKPDVVARGIVGEILTRFERVGLKLLALKMLTVSRELAGKHYEKDDDWLIAVGKRVLKNKGLNVEEHSPKEHGQKVCDSLAHDLTVYPVLPMIFEGHNAVALVRKMIGETSPEDAQPGTIRADYSLDTYMLANHCSRPVINLIHASDSVENAEKEIELWFKKEEICAWKSAEEELLFRTGK